MARTGYVHIIYAKEDDPSKRVVVPYRFKNFIWLIKIMFTAYKTRCTHVKIAFDKKQSNGKTNGQHKR